MNISLRTNRKLPGSNSRQWDTSVFRHTTGDLDHVQPHAYFAAYESPAIDATCVRPMGIAAVKAENEWNDTPNFGPFYHSQRWRLIT